MPDGLRLDGDGGGGAEIADIDIAPRHVDQEACAREQRIVAKPGCQKPASAIEPLALGLGRELARLVVQNVLREIGLRIGAPRLLEGAVALRPRRLHLDEGKPARADEADGDEQPSDDAAAVAAYELCDPIGHRVGPRADGLVREEAAQVLRECADGGVALRGVFFERLAENGVKVALERAPRDRRVRDGRGTGRLLLDDGVDQLGRRARAAT